MDFKKANIFTGWAIFLVATIVYVITIEPTTSFWDCGEFITTAYKLQVGHPPGAPLFMMLGRLFSAFVPVEFIAYSINILSAVSSSLTILFLFWTITHFGLKMAVNKGETPDTGKIIAIMASGIVGGLAYTFSDSFWFSAVEGEVYAMSSLFTAAVFWAILKWESLSDGKTEMRWIIVIAYLMGLSIGVHLLNLLAIPAICFVFYFKRYDPSLKGIIATGVVSLLILGVIQSGIIPGVVSLAGKFELLFVNDFGMPFNTGVIVYALLVIAALTFGLYYTQKSKNLMVNTALLSITMIILGYSTFAVIVIRSSANPPLDENNPENVFTLLSYLNREQYGDRPLLYGPYWNSPIDPASPRSDGSPVYTKSWLVVTKAGSTERWFSEKFRATQYLAEAGDPNLSLKQAYIITDAKKDAIVNYDDRFQSLLPRMHSSQDIHVQAYKSWSEFVGTPIRATGNDGQPTIINKPTFGENMKFFFRYQVNWMYWRYFMWNFAGRQNDIQGHGGIMEGNWLSGINMIDNERLGPQETLPSSMSRNFAYNKFFLLPLALGLLGLLYQLFRRPDDWFITMLLFLLTGMAIVVYLNQTPYQPRERDYAYAGSFYAFAIWIGLGVYALFDAAFNLSSKQLQKVAGYTLSAGVVVYLLESAQGASHYFSYSVLFMGILVVAIMAIMHLSGKSIKNTSVIAVLALLITIPVPLVMAVGGWDDHNRSDRYTARDFATNYLESCEPNAILFTNGDNDTFPLWYAQEVEGVRTDVRVVNLSLLNTDWYINQMKRQSYESSPVPFKMDEEKYRQGTRDVVLLDDSRNPGQVALNVKQAIDYATNDRNMRTLGTDKLAILPSKTFYIPVDRETVLGNGTVLMADSANIVDRVEWRINRSYILKNNLMVMDLLANNNWERPIYFAVTTGPDSYINLDKYFKLTGLAYRLTPILSADNPNPNVFGSVDTERMYDNVMNKFKWGGMEGEKAIYMDENNLRMTNNFRLQFANLADQLIAEEKIDKANQVLDKCVEVMPEHNVPFDRLMMPIIEAYYRTGESEKANALIKQVFDRYEEDFQYYMSVDADWALQMQQEIQMAYAVLQRSTTLVSRVFPQDELKEDFQDRFDRLDSAFDDKIQSMEKMKARAKIKF
jgi:hypothetical protein